MALPAARAQILDDHDCFSAWGLGTWLIKGLAPLDALWTQGNGKRSRRVRHLAGHWRYSRSVHFTERILSPSFLLPFWSLPNELAFPTRCHLSGLGTNIKNAPTLADGTSALNTLIIALFSTWSLCAISCLCLKLKPPLAWRILLSLHSQHAFDWLIYVSNLAAEMAFYLVLIIADIPQPKWRSLRHYRLATFHVRIALCLPFTFERPLFGL